MSRERDMTCDRVREALLDEPHGRLSPDATAALHAHLSSCPECARVAAEERALSELLRTRLPRTAAPRALHQRLAQQLTAADVQAAAALPRRRTRTSSWFIASAAAALLAVVGVSVSSRGPSSEAPLVREALNDHLRVLYAEHPLEIESSDHHQVKPWFTGRLDFTIDSAFSGDDEFPLVGGAVGYFVDRKAAVLVFKRRLHTITWLVFRAAPELPWPSGTERVVDGGLHVQLSTLDGFHVVLWRDAGLGHALISDVSEPELLRLTEKLIHAR